jgi:tetratricopeptide (TPR) repeat protein
VLLAAAGMALFGEWGAIAGVLLAIYPPALFLDGLLDKSALVSVFTAALLFLLAARRLRFREFLAGVVLGLLSLTRENALLLAVPVLLWFLIGDRQPVADDSPRKRASSRRKPSWLAAAACVGGCALVLLPVGARNYAVGREFLLTTSQFGPNFYIGNHAGARGLYEPLVPWRGNAADEQDDARQLAEKASGHALSPGEVSSFWTGRALDFIRAQPREWLGQLRRKLELTYNASEVADTESQDVYAEWSPLMRALTPVSFGVIFCLAALGVCMTAPAWRRLWFLYAIVLTYTLSIVIFYVFARYRFPLAEMLMLFAAGGVAALRETLSARPMRRWAFAAAAAVLVGVLAYRPLVNTRIDRIAHYVNIGNAFLVDPDPNKQGQAVVFYEKALKESPQSPAAHFGMGMLMAQMHRPKDAVPHYLTAVQGWSDNADLRLNFALALSDSGNNETALEELAAAARLRPDDPTPILIAGKLLLKQSRPAEALKAYDRALAIQPKNVDALMGSGVALTQLNRVEEAIQKYRLALQVDPRNADAYDGLGYTLETDGRLDGAVQEYEQAISLNPNDQDARNHLKRAQDAIRAKHK